MRSPLSGPFTLVLILLAATIRGARVRPSLQKRPTLAKGGPFRPTPPPTKGELDRPTPRRKDLGRPPRKKARLLRPKRTPRPAKKGDSEKIRTLAFKVVDNEAELALDDPADQSACKAAVRGAINRSCNGISGQWACRGGRTCRCPKFAKMAGQSPDCKDAPFNPEDMDGKGCFCDAPPYVPIDKMEANFECREEYGLRGFSDELPDVAENAFSWCDARLVPKEKRVPPFFRGFFWMMNLVLDDVAFCGSLAEWDAETRTARLAVWTHFMFRRHPQETVPFLATTAKRQNLIYSIKFEDDTFTSAKIWTNSRALNAFIKFPIKELEQDAFGGTIKRKKPGDIWDRPSFFGPGLKREVEGARYHAVRVVDDQGVINKERYSLMRHAEGVKGGTYVRYGTYC